MQYIIREIPNHWTVAKLYFPMFEKRECKIYEIIFGDKYKGKGVEVTLLISNKDNMDDFTMYFADGKGKVSKVKHQYHHDKIEFFAKQVGVYIQLQNDNKSYNFLTPIKCKFSKIFRDFF